ncbi:MAG: hypothetical protein WCP89_02880, partial [archaeon]
MKIKKRGRKEMNPRRVALVSIAIIFAIICIVMPLVIALTYSTPGDVYLNQSMTYNSYGFFNNITSFILSFGKINQVIDDVMIFNRSLSANEISALYANQTSKYLNETYNNLADGAHTLQVFAQDLGGSITSTNNLVTIGTAMPTITLSNPLNNSYWNSSSVLFNVTSSLTASGNGSIVPNLDNSLVSWWRMDDLNSSGGVV